MTSQPRQDAAARQWVAETEVSAELAARLLAAQFPALRGVQVRLLGAGWDMTVFVADGQWICRFPRREIALAGLSREISLLPRLAPLLPLPVPVPELIGSPSADYPWPFWAARLLPGIELAEAGLPESRRGAAAERTGEFLRALHDPAIFPTGGAGLAVDPMRRGDSVTRAAKAAEVLARLADRGRWQPSRPVGELLERAAATRAPDAGAADLVLCHGDLHVRHLLVDEAGQACGVIDWGDMCLADPAVDLSIAYAAFSGPARSRLLAAYGPVSERRELAARALAVSLCALLAEYGLTRTARPCSARACVACTARQSNRSQRDLRPR
ncbi:MAG TPA: phosphotransferase [Streptosporangiaceae bacterium]